MNVKLHRLLINATGEPLSLSQREIASVINMSKSSVGDWTNEELREPGDYISSSTDEENFRLLKEYIEDSRYQDSEPSESIGESGLSAVVMENGTRIIKGTIGGEMVDARDLFKLMNLNEDEWIVQKLTVKPRTVAMKLRHETVRPDGSIGFKEVPHSHNAWSLHAELRPNRDVQVKIKSMERLLQGLRDVGPRGIMGMRPWSDGEQFDTPHCLVINIADLHLGKLAVNEGWNIKDAMAEHERAVRFMLEQAGVYNIEEIIIWWGNDLTQTDNVKGMTTKGTQVESNASWYSQFDAGVELGIQTANIAREYCDRVYIHHVAGNHDWNTSYGICKALEAYFHNAEDIEVRVYKHGVADHVYGKNFFMGVHGNNATFKNAAGFMAVEYPKQWYECPFREMHTGHLHKKDGGYFITEYAEDKGVTVRQAPSLSPTDSWHHLKTFVGTLRAAQSYLYGKDTGFKATFNWNADAYNGTL